MKSCPSLHMSRFSDAQNRQEGDKSIKFKIPPMKTTKMKKGKNTR